MARYAYARVPRLKNLCLAAVGLVAVQQKPVILAVPMKRQRLLLLVLSLFQPWLPVAAAVGMKASLLPVHADRYGFRFFLFLPFLHNRHFILSLLWLLPNLVTMCRLLRLLVVDPC